MVASWLAALAPLATPAAAQLPAVATEAPLDVRQGVNFHALVRPDTVYVGQQANYQVGVFLGDEVRARLRRNPEFVPPEMTGMLAYELPVTHGAVPGGGGRFEVHVFERAVFPLMPGVHQVPPARLSYSLPLTRSFFSREESHVLRSQPVRVVALAPPESGRPADYSGAVASGLSLSTLVRDDSSARVGDPLLLTIRVTGRGNVNLFPRPRLDLPWAQAVATDERVRLDSTSRLVTGTKEFDWLVTPRQPGRVAVPAVRYPYFDPYAERYELAVGRPVSIAVAPGTLAALDSAAAEGPSTLPLRRRYRGEHGRPPADAPLFWLAAALCPLPAVVLRWRRRGPQRRRPGGAAAALAAMQEGVAVPPPRRVRAIYLQALVERLGLRSLPLERTGALARLLRREGVSPAAAAEAESLLATLDSASYAGGVDEPERDRALATRARESYGRVDEEARRRGGAGAGRVAGLLLVGLLGAGAARAVQPVPTLTPRVLFEEGVRSYEARRFDAAAELFAAATRRAPRSSDAWANLGTAAWAASDSARAAYGWQRALRLEPTAGDVRTRLGLLATEQLAGGAAVPPLPPALLQWLALAAWLLAWVLAARVARRRSALATAPAAVTGAVAALLGGGAVILEERLAARDLAVVAEAAPLRATPALSARAPATVPTGAVVRTGARTGVWTRVESPVGVGWVASSHLQALRAD